MTTSMVERNTVLTTFLFHMQLPHISSYHRGVYTVLFTEIHCVSFNCYILYLPLYCIISYCYTKQN